MRESVLGKTTRCAEDEGEATDYLPLIVVQSGQRHQTASYSPKMASLHFCTSGSEMPLTEESSLYKKPYPPSSLHSVSTANTLFSALYLQPLPLASRISSLDYYRLYHSRLLHFLAML